MAKKINTLKFREVGTTGDIYLDVDGREVIDIVVGMDGSEEGEGAYLTEAIYPGLLQDAFSGNPEYRVWLKAECSPRITVAHNGGFIAHNKTAAEAFERTIGILGNIDTGMLLGAMLGRGAFMRDLAKNGDLKSVHAIVNASNGYDTNPDLILFALRESLIRLDRDPLGVSDMLYSCGRASLPGLVKAIKEYRITGSTTDRGLASLLLKGSIEEIEGYANRAMADMFLVGDIS